MKWVLRILGGLAGVLLLGVVVLFAMGQRSTANRMQASIEVNAPPARVWTWINDGDKLKQWVSWMVEVRDDGPRRTLVMRDENNGGQLMEIHCAVAESTPPTRLRVAMSTPGMFDGDHLYELADLGGGRTRLQITGTYRFSMWLAKLMEPVITPSAERKLVGDMARLKSLVEAEQ